MEVVDTGAGDVLRLSYRTTNLGCNIDTITFVIASLPLGIDTSNTKFWQIS